MQTMGWCVHLMESVTFNHVIEHYESQVRQSRAMTLNETEIEDLLESDDSPDNMCRLTAWIVNRPHHGEPESTEELAMTKIRAVAARRSTRHGSKFPLPELQEHSM